MSMPGSRHGLLRFLNSRARSSALLLCALLAACQTVENSSQPIRDIRSPETRETPGRDTATPPAATPREGDSEGRRLAVIRLELATGYYLKGNYAQALDELKTSAAADPTLPQVYGMYGLVYMDLKEFAKAEESFQRALRLAPEDSETLNNYGWFLCQTNRPRESIAQFQAALRNPLYQTPSRPMHNAGICSLRAGDAKGAEAWFEQAFKVDPGNPVAMYHLAEIHLKRGEFERARFFSQRLLSSFPPSAETLWLGVRVGRLSGDSEGAAALSSQLRRQFPGSREANLLQRGSFD